MSTSRGQRAIDWQTRGDVCDGVFVHPLALCESESVGARTRIWPFAHVMRGAVIGADCCICDHVFIESGAVLGDRVTVKNGSMIWESVVVGDDAFIGPGAIFTNDRYPRSARGEQCDRFKEAKEWLVGTRVEEGATIGAGAVILCGNKIGRYATVAAGAVVTHDVPAHRLIAGNPARPVGWVCFCGQPLDDRLSCPKCARRYALAGKTLKTL